MMMFKKIVPLAMVSHQLIGSTVGSLALEQESTGAGRVRSPGTTAPFVAIHSPTVSKMQEAAKAQEALPVTSVFMIDRRELAKKKKKRISEERNPSSSRTSLRPKSTRTKPPTVKRPPTASPTRAERVLVPTTSPSDGPSSMPSISPSKSPSERPSSQPSPFPSQGPSEFPSSIPSPSPSATPSLSPSVSRSAEPSLSPSESPSFEPSLSQSPSACYDDSEVTQLLNTLEPISDVCLMLTANTPQNGAYDYVVAHPFPASLDPEFSDFDSSAWLQRFAVSVLYYSTANGDTKLPDWAPTASVPVFECDWSGITCPSPDGKTVTAVTLDDLELEGTIPSELVGLSALTSLSLSNNPSLVANNLVAVASLSNLKYLDLRQNGLTSIPTELGQLQHLEELYVSLNTWGLTVPAEVCALLTTGSLTTLKCGMYPYEKFGTWCCDTSC